MSNKILNFKLSRTILTVLLAWTLIYSQNAYPLAKLFTINGGLGLSLLNLNIKSSDGSSNISGENAEISQVYNGVGGNFNVMFDVWRWISFEVMYNDMGKSKVTSFNTIRDSGDISIQGTSMNFVYSYPVRNYGLQYHGKLGLFNLSTETDLDYVRQSNNTGVSLSGSMSYFTRSGWGGQVNLNYHSKNLQVISAGISRRFDIITKETELSNNFVNIERNNLQNVLNETKQRYENLNSIQSAVSNFLTDKTGAITRLTEDVDGDGIPDELDDCPGTPLGATVDSSGCLVQGALENNSDAVNDSRLYPDEGAFVADDDVIEEINNSIIQARFERDYLITSAELRTLQEAGLSSRQEGFDVEDLLGVRVNSQSEIIEDSSTADQLLDRAQQTKDNLEKVLGSARSILEASILENETSVTNNLFKSSNSQSNTPDKVGSGLANIEQKKMDDNFESSLESLKEEIANTIGQSDQPSYLNPGLSNSGKTQSQISDLGEDNYSQINQPIIFDDGGSNLSGGNKQQLDNVASILRENRTVKLEVKSFAKNSDSSSLVSKNQVQEVFNYLLENGVNSSQLVKVNDSSSINGSSEEANQVLFSLSD